MFLTRANKIKTAVIPAGGYGTRFLPATKCIPKEMFPLGDKPIILHVVEEAVKSGIENIIFIVSPHKQSIESFFSSNEILEEYFLKDGKQQQVKKLREITKLAKFSFVYTQPPLGNGGALLSVKHLVKNEPFVFVWSDELFVTKGKPRIKQCLETFYKYGQPVISAVEIADKSRRRFYGMAELKNFSKNKEVKKIVRIVEKPKPGREPSVYATHGAYVLTPEIFQAFKKIKAGPDQEITIVDLLNVMKEKTGLLAKIIPDCLYLDCGNPINYLFSQIEYANSRPEYRKEIKAWLNRHNF